MNPGLKIIYLVLLAIYARLGCAADLPPEYDLMVEYRSLYSELRNNDKANEASMTKRRRMSRLERELQTAGLTDAEFAVLRKSGLRYVPTAADKADIAEVSAALNTYESSGSGPTYRSKFVDKILAMGKVAGLEQLASMIPNIAADDPERISLEERILIFLENKNHPYSSIVRRQIIQQITEPTRNKIIRGPYGLGNDLQTIFDLALNPKEENDFPATVAALELLVTDLNHMQEIKELISTLDSYPEFISQTLVETLFRRNNFFPDNGYIYELLRLMRHLPTNARQPMVVGGLFYINRFTVEADYFLHPVFNEDHFLEVLSEQLEWKHSASYVRGMNDIIFTRPEFTKRKDLSSLAPHIVIQACDNVLARAADEN